MSGLGSQWRQQYKHPFQHSAFLFLLLTFSDSSWVGHCIHCSGVRIVKWPGHASLSSCYHLELLFSVCVCEITESCLTLLWPPTPDCNRPGSTVHVFPRQEYWSGLLFPTPRDPPDPGIKLASPALAGRFFTTSTTWEAHIYGIMCKIDS